MSPSWQAKHGQGLASATTWQAKQDIAAPGDDILAAYPPIPSARNGYAFSSGASMASLRASGIVALLRLVSGSYKVVTRCYSLENQSLFGTTTFGSGRHNKDC
ncbi:unnamed protein product [Fraxinus pennsylvanica]|uniref:Peptidase S8/S53 domain-containing protein n=1 Tax=Fraxinus pennsylvanica TaxID=56036 RepID=A0AAD1YYQ2_9LAMI|nr:unnamed protein product [Fraxinus pennsylvanica]